MQNEINKIGLLHKPNGSLSQKGWARSPLLQYKRKAVKAAKFKIKEWDYYCILSENKGISFTVADNGYLGFVACTWLDFLAPEEISKSVMAPFPMGAFKMPESPEKGNIEFKRKGVSMRFIWEDAYRIIELDIKDFSNGKPLRGSVRLSQPTDMESMVIATPFKACPKAFYYNQKVNCMPAEGQFNLGDEKMTFMPDTSMGVLDWGRGVWTYSNTWYWGSASGRINGVPFGFNIGYGFGDTSMATENMLFYNGKAHKLEDVKFHIDNKSYLKPWKFTSNNGRFEMDFVPILDRASRTNVLIIESDQHQVFGHFTGQAILDDGQVLEIRNLLGFAEKVKNRW